ncbi:MAG: LysM peptidoglycan-binding domain-containing protein, partial [Bacteroidales bacterium]|nr:LysM peptidoglycan-binding domain-containing protein [Bacteroidales bacterium]
MIKRFFTAVMLMMFAFAGIMAQVNVEISEEKILENGQKFYLHTVKQGQTLYSICKAYSVTEK